MNIEYIINLLQEISDSDNYKERMNKILSFQKLMYLGNIELKNEKIEEILDILAYDLEYYQPEVKYRVEGITYLNDQELIEKIKNIVDQIYLLDKL